MNTVADHINSELRETVVITEIKKKLIVICKKKKKSMATYLYKNNILVSRDKNPLTAVLLLSLLLSGI